MGGRKSGKPSRRLFLSLGEGLLLQTLYLESPNFSTHLHPLPSELLEDLIDIHRIAANLLTVLVIRTKRRSLPLVRPLPNCPLCRLALALDICSDHVETRAVLVLHVGLEEADPREPREGIEQAQAVPRLGLVHEHDHAAAGPDARERDCQLRGPEAGRLAVLAVRGHLVGAQDAALARHQVELLAGPDLPREEVVRVRVVGGHVTLGHAEVCREHGDVCLDQAQAPVPDEALYAVVLGGQGDAYDLDVGIDLQCGSNKTAWRASEGEHAGPLARKGKDAGGLLHLGPDALHHSQEDLARLLVGVVGEVALPLEVSVALWVLPAL